MRLGILGVSMAAAFIAGAGLVHCSSTEFEVSGDGGLDASRPEGDANVDGSSTGSGTSVGADSSRSHEAGGGLGAVCNDPIICSPGDVCCVFASETDTAGRCAPKNFCKSENGAALCSTQTGLCADGDTCVVASCTKEHFQVCPGSNLCAPDAAVSDDAAMGGGHDAGQDAGSGSGTGVDGGPHQGSGSGTSSGSGSGSAMGSACSPPCSASKALCCQVAGINGMTTSCVATQVACGAMLGTIVP
jgi:hypothetical protein